MHDQITRLARSIPISATSEILSDKSLGILIPADTIFTPNLFYQIHGLLLDPNLLHVFYCYQNETTQTGSYYLQFDVEKDRTCVSHFVPAEELDISAPDQTNWPALMIPIFALNGSFYAFAKTQAEVGDLTVMQLLIHALEGGFNIEAHHLAPSDFLCIDLNTPADFQHIQELLKTNAVFMDEVN